MNAEIIHRLECSFDTYESLDRVPRAEMWPGRSQESERLEQLNFLISAFYHEVDLLSFMAGASPDVENADAYKESAIALHKMRLDALKKNILSLSKALNLDREFLPKEFHVS